MKFDGLSEKLSLTLAAGTPPEEFEGVYVGDLLSRCMSHVTEGNIWITIMSNINAVAVASLTEAACMILAEGGCLPEDAVNAAEEKEICVFSSPLTAYEICEIIAKLK